MIRGLSKTKKIYNCSLIGLYHVVFLIKMVVKFHEMDSFNLSKVGSQPQDSSYPDEGISQDGGKSHSC